MFSEYLPLKETNGDSFVGLYQYCRLAQGLEQVSPSAQGRWSGSSPASTTRTNSTEVI